MSITIKVYSERGLVVKGITEAQAQAILGELGKAVCQYNPMMGGYVFSRKREAQIRAAVGELQGGLDIVPPAPVATDGMPFPLA